ncbi:GRB2-associated-binding protein 2 [Cricetulus griseus]|uniref:GRB2-associated-binding protein 2 n=1 Tax=Cricetulus griseus TaxID=10029 RepID=G3GSH6_CRIGR|nr:GRB2-associated-binding protein 2 [Cricetulus griseus]
MLRKLLKKYEKSFTEESLPLELCTSSQLTQQPVLLSTRACCRLQSACKDVVCWLEKLPPEKKSERYAWKKSWFILRRGQMTGDQDVLEYYKNEHSKKPLWNIKTNELTFYLVAETEADMNSLASDSHTKYSLTGSEADSEDVYTFKAPSNNLSSEFGDLLVDSAIAPPPQHTKTPQWGSSQQRHVPNMRQRNHLLVY